MVNLENNIILCVAKKQKQFESLNHNLEEPLSIDSQSMSDCNMSKNVCYVKLLMF